MRRWLVRAWLLLFVGGVAFSVGVALGAPVAWPFDVVYTLGPGVDAPELRAPGDGKVRVVVLQHGMWRTSASMLRLARTLEAHGYEVLNPGYRSTRGQIEQFAAQLHDAIEARAARGPVDEWSFVGHSMGGLVIEEYLRRADARAPHACVYLGTPHRGAVLADLRRHWLLFEIAMGTGAAAQLATTDPLHLRPIPFRGCSGTVVGDRGDGNASIPGPDDGTVAVGEATFAGAADSVVLPVGHTSMTVARVVQRQVLQFLRKGAFDHAVAAGFDSGGSRDGHRAR
ncbi:MAG: alpha/beta hydrolase [Planctomycetes bacterium]|nr:alpha/beta hydrolase [Planctomycetota bacterium]